MEEQAAPVDLGREGTLAEASAGADWTKVFEGLRPTTDLSPPYWRKLRQCAAGLHDVHGLDEFQWAAGQLGAPCEAAWAELVRLEGIALKNGYDNLYGNSYRAEQLRHILSQIEAAKGNVMAGLDRLTQQH